MIIYFLTRHYTGSTYLSNESGNRQRIIVVEWAESWLYALMRRLYPTGPMPHANYDVVVVGAGGAGVAFLEHIDTQALRVLCIDRAPFPRHKACSGILVKEAIEYFDRNSIPASVLEEPNIIDIEYIDRDNNSSRLVQKGFLNSKRSKLDAWHFSKVAEGDFDFAPSCILRKIIHPESPVPLGADGPQRLQMTSRPFTPQQAIEPPRPNGHNHGAGKITLQIEFGNKQHTVHCQTLIGADGATSVVRNEFVPIERRPKKYFLIQEYFAGAPIKHGRFISDSRLGDYYGWVIPKNGRTEIGAALEPKGWRPRFTSFKNEILSELGLDSQVLERQSFFSVRPRNTDQLFFGRSFSNPPASGGAKGSAVSQTGMAPNHSASRITGCRVMLVGEAAGLISPSSAEGISFSLWSGRYAAEALNDGAYQEPLVDYKAAMIPWLDRLALKMEKARELRQPERRRNLRFRVSR